MLHANDGVSSVSAFKSLQQTPALRAGFEPTYSRLLRRSLSVKLPENDRNADCQGSLRRCRLIGGASRSRTLRAIQREIYSLPRLRTGLMPHVFSSRQTFNRRIPFGFRRPSSTLASHLCLSCSGSGRSTEELPSLLSIILSCGILPLLLDVLCFVLFAHKSLLDFVELGRVELPTSRSSDVRSNRLSYSSKWPSW